MDRAVTETGKSYRAGEGTGPHSPSAVGDRPGEGGGVSYKGARKHANFHRYIQVRHHLPSGQVCFHWSAARDMQIPRTRRSGCTYNNIRTAVYPIALHERGNNIRIILLFRRRRL